MKKKYPNSSRTCTSWLGFCHKTTECQYSIQAFLDIFSGLCDIAFPEQKIKIKTKTLNSPWITKDL